MRVPASLGQSGVKNLFMDLLPHIFQQRRAPPVFIAFLGRSFFYRLFFDKAGNIEIAIGIFLAAGEQPQLIIFGVDRFFRPVSPGLVDMIFFADTLYPGAADLAGNRPECLDQQQPGLDTMQGVSGVPDQLTAISDFRLYAAHLDQDLMTGPDQAESQPEYCHIIESQLQRDAPFTLEGFPAKQFDFKIFIVFAADTAEPNALAGHHLIGLQWTEQAIKQLKMASHQPGPSCCADISVKKWPMDRLDQTRFPYSNIT